MRRPAALCWMLGAAAIVATVLPAGWAHALEIKRVKLDNGHEVLAKLAGKVRRHRIRVVLGDRVTVAVSPYDPTRGFIVYRQR